MSDLNFPFSDPYPFGEARLAAAGGGGGPSPLPDGVYWQSGDASSKPPTTGQGWISTLVLNDNPVNDTATRETASGATISVLDIRTAFSMTTWNLIAKWKGTVASAFYYWDGSAWQVLVVSSPAPLPHASYTDDTVQGGFFSVPSAKQHLVVLTESDTSGGNMSVSDERPS
jgi:hypothetical protein